MSKKVLKNAFLVKNEVAKNDKNDKKVRFFGPKTKGDFFRSRGFLPLYVTKSGFDMFFGVFFCHGKKCCFGLFEISFSRLRSNPWRR